MGFLSLRRVGGQAPLPQGRGRDGHGHPRLGSVEDVIACDADDPFADIRLHVRAAVQHGDALLQLVLAVDVALGGHVAYLVVLSRQHGIAQLRRQAELQVQDARLADIPSFRASLAHLGALVSFASSGPPAID